MSHRWQVAAEQWERWQQRIARHLCNEGAKKRGPGCSQNPFERAIFRSYNTT